jgi:hypothetical protein
MKLFSSSILLIAIVFSFAACKGQKDLSSKDKYAQLVNATSQRTLPGVRGADIITSYTFDICWNNDQPPISFFWKDGDRWMNCTVYKIVKGLQPKEIAPEQAKKGDTLQLIPTPGGRHVMPAEINKDLERGIFYKTASSGWMYLEVKTMTKKPDIAMP